MRPTFKPLMALIASFSLVVLGAPPSAATTGMTTGGTMTINLTPTLTIPMAGTATSACTGSVSSIVMSSPSSGTATITWSMAFSYSGGTYIMSGVGSASVTVSTTSIVFSSVVMTGVNIYNVVSPTCTISGAKCGSTSMNFAAGLTGSWFGSTSPPDLSGRAHLGATVSIAAGGCTPPFMALNGKTATVSSWAVDY